MEIENLERAAQIHEQCTSLNNALKAVEMVNVGDEEGDIIIENISELELIEKNTQYSLKLKGCLVGGEIIDAIENILRSKLEDLLKEAKKL